MLKSSPATNFGIFSVVGIGNQTPLMIRTKCNIYSIIDRILTHQLLRNLVIHITKLSQVISLIYLSKMMVIHVEFEIHNISNTDIFPIRILNLVLPSPAEHSINNYTTLNFPCVQKLRGDNINIIISFVSIIQYRRKRISKLINIEIIKTVSRSSFYAELIVNSIVNLY